MFLLFILLIYYPVYVNYNLLLLQLYNNKAGLGLYPVALIDEYGLINFIYANPNIA